MTVVILQLDWIIETFWIFKASQVRNETVSHELNANLIVISNRLIIDWIQRRFW